MTNPMGLIVRKGGKRLQNFYNSFSFIIAFLILLLFFNIMFGGKFIEDFLALVLASMIVVNADKFASIFNGISKEA